MFVLVERNDTSPYKCETCSQLKVARLLLQKGAKPAMQDKNRLKCKFIYIITCVCRMVTHHCMDIEWTTLLL